MGTMKAAFPSTYALLARPHSIAVVALAILFAAAFVLPEHRRIVSAFGLCVVFVALPFVGKQTSPATRWMERVSMLQFGIIFLQWVAK